MNTPARKWTLVEKLRVLIEASRLDESKLGEFLRREGVHEAQLKQWRAEVEAERWGWFEPKWLFPTQQNTPLDYSRMADEYRATLKAAGLTDFTPYSMRHTFAALRLSAGALPMWVSQQLGHRDLTTTLRYYGEFIPKRGETWADILERGVLEPTPQVAIPESETQTSGEAAPDWDAELGELTTEKSGAGGGS